MAPPKKTTGAGYAIRIDDWEDITHKIRQNTSDKKCENTPALQSLFNHDETVQTHVMHALGYKAITEDNNTITGYQHIRRPKKVSHGKSTPNPTKPKSKPKQHNAHSPFAMLQDLVKTTAVQKPKKSKKKNKAKKSHKVPQHG